MTCGAVRSLPHALRANRGAGPDDWLPSARHGALSEACRRVLQGKQALAAALDHLVIPRRRELALAPWEARTLVMGLRRLDGLTRAAFQQASGYDYTHLCGDTIAWLCQEGLLEDAGDRLRLTEQGLFLSDGVFAELV